MKFLVAVDCEGEACVVGQPGMTLNESRNWEFARRQAAREADAAAKGLFDAGATQVIIWDNHGSSVNLDYDLIDERCDIALGVGTVRRWPTVDKSFAGVLMVGYHPMDNTVDGVLAHSFSSMAFQWIKVNGVEVGEMEIDAAVAGEAGVPLIFVSSDDKGTAEAKRFMPWVETVAVKQGLGWNMALSKHPKRAAAEIREGASRAAGRLKEMKTFAFNSPMTVEIRSKRMDDAEARSRGHSGWERVDPFTCRRTYARISELF